MLFWRFIAIARLIARCDSPRILRVQQRDAQVTNYLLAPTVCFLAAPVMMPRTSSSEEVFSINLDLGAGVLGEQNAVTFFHCERE